jgi:hypothetical protein
MAAKNVIKKKGEEAANIVVNKIVLQNVDRTKKDIVDWHNAYVQAGNVSNPLRIRLLDLYERILLDGHLQGVITRRRSAVLNKKLRFIGNDGKKIDEMDGLINSKEFRDLRCLLFDKKLFGLFGIEAIVGDKFRFEAVNRKHIKPDLRMITWEQSGTDGVNYDEDWRLWVLGSQFELGLLLKCAPYVLWKQGNMADWAQYIELFGQPVIITKYDASDIKTKQELEEVMLNAGSSLRISLPTQANFEMHDGKTSNANGDLQDKFKDACDDEISKIILTVTETTTSSKSSGFAQANVHSKQQLEITKDDLEDERGDLNNPVFLNIIKSFGWKVDNGQFEHEPDVDITMLQQRIIVDAQLEKIIPIDDDYFYRTYGIEKPDNYDALKKKMDDQKQNPFGVPGNQFPPADPSKQDVKPKASWYERVKALKNFFD